MTNKQLEQLLGLTSTSSSTTKKNTKTTKAGDLISRTKSDLSQWIQSGAAGEYASALAQAREKEKEEEREKRRNTEKENKLTGNRYNINSDTEDTSTDEGVMPRILPASLTPAKLKDKQGSFRSVKAASKEDTSDKENTSAQSSWLVRWAKDRAEKDAKSNPKKVKRYRGVEKAQDIGGKAIHTGLTGFNSAIMGAIDLIVPDVIPIIGSGTKKIADSYRSADKQAQQSLSQAIQNADGKAWDVYGQGLSILTNTAIQAIPAILTAGGSLGAQTLGAASSSASTIGTAAASMIKNPNFWFSAAMEAGSSFNDQLDKGLDRNNAVDMSKAVTTATITGLINGAIEMGGGIETQAAKYAQNPGAKSGLRDWAKSALEEGAEEVKQGIVSRGMYGISKNGDVNGDNKLDFSDIISVENEDAIISVMGGLKEFAGGAFGGGVIGGGQIAIGNLINNSATMESLGNAILDSKGVSQKELIDSGLQMPKNSGAYKVAKQLSNDKKVSARDIGKLYTHLVDQYAKAGAAKAGQQTNAAIRLANLQKVENTLKTTPTKAKNVKQVSDAADDIATSLNKTISDVFKSETTSPETIANSVLVYLSDPNSVMDSDFADGVIYPIIDAVSQKDSHVYRELARTVSSQQLITNRNELITAIAEKVKAEIIDNQYVPYGEDTTKSAFGKIVQGTETVLKKAVEMSRNAKNSLYGRIDNDSESVYQAIKDHNDFSVLNRRTTLTSDIITNFQNSIEEQLVTNPQATLEVTSDGIVRFTSNNEVNENGTNVQTNTIENNTTVENNTTAANVEQSNTAVVGSITDRINARLGATLAGRKGIANTILNKLSRVVTESRNGNADTASRKLSSDILRTLGMAKSSEGYSEQLNGMTERISSLGRMAAQGASNEDIINGYLSAIGYTQTQNDVFENITTSVISGDIDTAARLSRSAAANILRSINITKSNADYNVAISNTASAILETCKEYAQSQTGRIITTRTDTAQTAAMLAERISKAFNFGAELAPDITSAVQRIINEYTQGRRQSAYNGCRDLAQVIMELSETDTSTEKDTSLYTTLLNEIWDVVKGNTVDAETNTESNTDINADTEIDDVSDLATAMADTYGLDNDTTSELEDGLYNIVQSLKKGNTQTAIEDSADWGDTVLKLSGMNGNEAGYKALHAQTAREIINGCASIAGVRNARDLMRTVTNYIRNDNRLTKTTTEAEQTEQAKPTRQETQTEQPTDTDTVDRIEVETAEPIAEEAEDDNAETQELEKAKVSDNGKVALENVEETTETSAEEKQRQNSGKTVATNQNTTETLKGDNENVQHGLLEEESGGHDRGRGRAEIQDTQAEEEAERNSETRSKGGNGRVRSDDELVRAEQSGNGVVDERADIKGVRGTGNGEDIVGSTRSTEVSVTAKENEQERSDKEIARKMLKEVEQPTEQAEPTEPTGQNTNNAAGESTEESAEESTEESAEESTEESAEKARRDYHIKLLDDVNASYYWEAKVDSRTGNTIVNHYDFYDAKRYGTPWVARVKPENGRPDFDNSVGAYTGRFEPGSEGDLFISTPQDGDVYMYGQKNKRGKYSDNHYVWYKDGYFFDIPRSSLQIAFDYKDTAKPEITETTETAEAVKEETTKAETAKGAEKETETSGSEEIGTVRNDSGTTEETAANADETVASAGRNISNEASIEEKINWVSETFGIDKGALQKMIDLKLTEGNINEFGRLDNIKEIADRQKVNDYFKGLPKSRVNMKFDKLLREFILNNTIVGAEDSGTTEQAKPKAEKAEVRDSKAETAEAAIEEETSGKTIAETVAETVEETTEETVEETTEETAEETTEDEAKPKKRNKQNHRIKDDSLDDKKPSFRDNTEAIKLLKRLDEENRMPTEQEREILLKYKGWGGLKRAFADTDTRATLRNLLTAEEFDRAERSVLNAFYTPIKVIDAIYKGVKRLGFKGGNVLEPSMGIGHFFGRMPAGIAAKSSLHGVEIDPITARIAQYLYPNADIENNGFERVRYNDGVFDLAVGNVPFGDISMKYGGRKYLIHDYFFLKSLDKLAPNGVCAFLTSTGTLDKGNLATRREIANRADLVAAYRLPSNIFSRSAGTDVTTDLIILRKRADGEVQSGETFESLGTLNGVLVNEYFVRHPENIFGNLSTREVMGRSQTYVEANGIDAIAELEKAMKKLPKNLMTGETKLDTVVKEAPIDVKAGFRRNENKIVKIDGTGKVTKTYSGKAAAKVSDYIDIRDAYENLLTLATNGAAETDMADARAELNEAYDKFASKHGALSKSNRGLGDDSEYIKVCGLEVFDGKAKKYKKSEIFERDTFNRKKPETARSAEDALAITLSETGKIDFKRMTELTSKSKEELTKDLAERIVETPDGEYQLIDVYLSGNVREKLKEAESKGYDKQAEMLRTVIPQDIPASRITPQLGATWIDADTIAQFISETLKVGKDDVIILYDPNTATWEVDVKTGRYGELMRKKFGTDDVDAITLIEKALNFKTVEVKRRSFGISVVDKEATRAAQVKQEFIKNEFADWVFRDQKRRAAMVEKFNDMFNGFRPLNYSGVAQYITTPELSANFSLRPYQKEAVARVVFGGNTLLAHGVGTGKTCEMITAAMELKRMGITHKNLFVVPKNKVSDFRNDILETFPNAKVLAAESGIMSAKNRQRTLAQIVANDWDIVVISHENLSAIPMSSKTQTAYIREQIDALETSLDELKGNKDADAAFVSKVAKAKENLEKRLKDAIESAKKDVGITFEELGVDGFFVDEAHKFKNLATYSKIQAPGVQIQGSQKAANMHMVTEYLRSTSGRVVFATATPLTNSMGEMYNMLKYIRPDILEDANMHSFDAWASTFCDIVEDVEYAPDGVSLRTQSRLSKFKNVYEMIGMFRQIADILSTQDAQRLNPDSMHLPEVERIDIVSPVNPYIEFFTGTVAKERIDRMGGKNNPDSMINVTTDGRYAALDIRTVKKWLKQFGMVATDYELDVASSKINKAVENIVAVYKDSNKTKGTQFVFLDLGVNDTEHHGASLYDNLVGKLIKAGIPETEIFTMREADPNNLQDVFTKMNNGEIRVLIGSTAKMGEGVNAQKKAVALHHIDVPYRPADIEQREGRIVRNGNENKKVKIFRYIQERSYDTYMWQMQERKAMFIAQAMAGGDIDEMEDIGEITLTAQEGLALASGNPKLLEKFKLEKRLANLKAEQKRFNSDLWDMQDRLARLPEQIASKEQYVSKLRLDAKNLRGEKSGFVIGNKAYSKQGEVNEAINKLLNKITKNGKMNALGIVRGLPLAYAGSIERGEKFYIGVSGFPVVKTINHAKVLSNAVNKITTELNKQETALRQMKQDLQTIKQNINNPWSKQQELNEVTMQLAELIQELGLTDIESIEVEMGEKAYSLNTTDDKSYNINYTSPVQNWATLNTESTQNNNKSQKTDSKSQKTNNKSQKTDVTGVHDIVRLMAKMFDIPISTGNMRAGRNVLGFFTNNAKTIRTRITNDLPTITHELGHALNEKYKLSSSEEINELVNWLRTTNPEFAEQYEDEDLPGEAVAEFLREYCRSVEDVENEMPDFYNLFTSTLSETDLTAINQIAQLSHDYFMADRRERARSAITTSKKMKKENRSTVVEKARKAYTAMVDSFHPIQRTVDFVEKTSGKLSGNDNAYMLALNSRGARAKVDMLIHDGFYDNKGNKTGDGFIDCISGISADKLDDFTLYLVYKHQLEWLDVPEADRKRVFADEQLEDVDFVKSEIEDMEAENEEFEEAANKLYKFQNRILKEYLVDTGMMSKETYNALLKKYPHYVPFKRNVGKGRLNGVKSAFSNQHLPLMRAKGSGAELINPLESIVKNVENAVNSSMRNHVMGTLAAYADNVEGFGKFIERVPPDMIPHTISLQSRKEKLKKFFMDDVTDEAIINAYDEIIDSIIGDTVTDYTPVASAKKQIVSVIRNGKTEYYQIHDAELFKSVSEIAPSQFNAIIGTIGKATAATNALITSSNPIFAMRNLLRDYQSLIMHGTAVRSWNPIADAVIYTKAWLRSVTHIINDSKEYKLYKSQGGGMQSNYNENIQSLAKALTRISEKDMPTAKRLVHSIFVHPIQTVVALNEVTESIPRLAEFEEMLKKTGDLNKAMYAANDVTINFARSGKTGRAINQIFRFSNAQVQGLDKEMRLFTTGSKAEIAQSVLRYALLNALMAAVTQALARAVAPDDWDKISKYQKNQNWLFAIGDGKFIKIPKGQEANIVGTLMSDTFDWITGDEEAFYQLGEYLSDYLVPSWLPTDLLKGDMKGAVNQVGGATVFGGIVEAALNEDYKGTPIVSDYMSYKPNKEQENDNTSFIAHEVGQMLGLSPLKVDHFLKDFGIVGTLATTIKKDFGKSDYTIGLKSAFTADRAYSTDMFNRTYERREKYERKYINDTTAKNASMYEKYAITAEFITQGKKAIAAEGLTGDAERKKLMQLQAAAQYMLKWNDTDKALIASFGNAKDVTFGNTNYSGAENTRPDAIPAASITQTKNGEKYSYTMTLNEYIKYIDRYMGIVKKTRQNYIDKYFKNMETAEKSDTISQIQSLAAKFVKDEWKKENGNKLKKLEGTK